LVAVSKISEERAFQERNQFRSMKGKKKSFMLSPVAKLAGQLEYEGMR